MVGMEDPDIVHSMMSVKEMIFKNYQLNAYTDDIANNSGVLTGNRPFIYPNALPKFHVPNFQPKVLARVPQVER